MLRRSASHNGRELRRAPERRVLRYFSPPSGTLLQFPQVGCLILERATNQTRAISRADRLIPLEQRYRTPVCTFGYSQFALGSSSLLTHNQPLCRLTLNSRKSHF